MNYKLTFKILGQLQSVIVAAETWEHAHTQALVMLSRMRYRRTAHCGIALVGVGFCPYLPEVK
jgi:hypothetical protein